MQILKCDRIVVKDQSGEIDFLKMKTKSDTEKNKYGSSFENMSYLKVKNFWKERES